MLTGERRVPSALVSMAIEVVEHRDPLNLVG
jgi:hypothetical protein